MAETLAQLSGEIEKNAALEGSLGTDCAALEERERALSGAISELQNKLLALTSGVEAKTGESRVVQERTENLLKERERLLSRVAENEAREKELSAALRRAKASFPATRGGKRRSGRRLACLPKSSAQWQGKLSKKKRCWSGRSAR